MNELFSLVSSWFTIPQASSSNGSHVPRVLQFLNTEKPRLLGQVKLAVESLGVAGQIYVVPDACITSFLHIIPMNSVVNSNFIIKIGALQTLTY